MKQREEYHQKYREENREQINERARARYMANREKFLQKGVEYRERHPEKAKNYYQ